MAATQQKAQTPLLWLDLDGNITVAGKPSAPRITAGASTLETPKGTVYAFNGEHGGVIFPDLDVLRLHGSMTISAWVFLRSYVIKGPNAQIFFRGDNRGGLDPYSLRIEGDKTLTFQIQDEKNDTAKVKSPGAPPLGRWFHVVVSFDERNGELAMWLNGEPAAHAFTRIRPFKDLDGGACPGVSVGNLQHDGPDNEPLNGLVGDLRLYDGVLAPREIPGITNLGG